MINFVTRGSRGRMHLSASLYAVLLLAIGVSTASAAVHQYNDDYFYAVADAYIFRGGREGLYASSAEVGSGRLR